nr:MAG TPA: hypothetical protein [Caudoviricetes sp.]DAR17350.1 MAG TPA: hypothetical protein [Caudoviricetes sp.]DAY27666.1 MAG TPA: hypothetical protein [Caudoviricetes sp.]
MNTDFLLVIKPDKVNHPFYLPPKFRFKFTMVRG